jgi:hypothetical protein
MFSLPESPRKLLSFKYINNSNVGVHIHISHFILIVSFKMGMELPFIKDVHNKDLAVQEKYRVKLVN